MMGSISTRLAAWYALAATVTLACLFVVGYQLLESYLIHGLDLLNTSEFEQLRARLGPDYRTLSLDVVNQRIRTTTEYASVLFYFDVNQPAEYQFDLAPGPQYRAEIIDPWEMTVTPVSGTFTGKFLMKLPGKPYQAVRFRKVD